MWDMEIAKVWHSYQRKERGKTLLYKPILKYFWATGMAIVNSKENIILSIGTSFKLPDQYGIDAYKSSHEI